MACAECIQGLSCSKREQVVAHILVVYPTAYQFSMSGDGNQ
jgi:hypothetical protein